MTASPPPVGWLRRLGPRLRRFWAAKAIGTTAGMTGFFLVYFQLLNHPLFPIATVPLLGLDRLVGFCPGALPLYFSLWVYVSLAPALLDSRRELVSYGVAAAALSAIGFGIFFFWPTAVPPSPIDWSRHPSLLFLKTADATGNACPSLHVAFAVFTGLWLDRLLREMGAGRPVRVANGAWCLGIAYSTLAVRQHVALDVLAGAGLGAAVAAAHFRFLRARPPEPAEA